MADGGDPATGDGATGPPPIDAQAGSPPAAEPTPAVAAGLAPAVEPGFSSPVERAADAIVDLAGAEVFPILEDLAAERARLAAALRERARAHDLPAPAPFEAARRVSAPAPLRRMPRLFALLVVAIVAVNLGRLFLPRASVRRQAPPDPAVGDVWRLGGGDPAALTSVVADGPRAVPALVEALRVRRDAATRRDAAEALARICEATTVTVSRDDAAFLERLGYDPDPAVRAPCTRARAAVAITEPE